MKLTPWFPGDVKPVRVGVYERNYGNDRLRDCNYCHWNGKFWSIWATTQRGAVHLKNNASRWQDLPWRGVEK